MKAKTPRGAKLDFIKSWVRRAHAFLALLAAFAASACGDNQDPQGAKELYARLEAADYRSWARAPGYESRQKSNAVHADFVDIYVNETVAKTLANQEDVAEWPEGSIVVKDGFDDDGELQVVAVMEKRSDGWYWAEYFDGSREAKYAGRPGVCIDCHQRGSDFTRALALPKTQ